MNKFINTYLCQKTVLISFMFLFVACGEKEKIKPAFSNAIKGDYLVNLNYEDKLCGDIKNEKYFMKIATPYDILGVKHFRNFPFQNPDEILLLNFDNLYDMYIIKGLHNHEKLIYIHGRRKEINDIKSVIGGTINVVTDSLLILNMDISELKRVNDKFHHYNEIHVKGSLKKLKIQ